MSDKPSGNSGQKSTEATDLSFDVFISYASADREVAEELAQRLSKSGLRIWSDQCLEPGEDWDEQIRRAIDNSRLCLILLSHSAVPSMPNVSKEWCNIQQSVWSRSDLWLCGVQLEDTNIPAFLRKWHIIPLYRTPRRYDTCASHITSIARRNTLEAQTTSVEQARDDTVERFTFIWHVLQEVANPDEDKEGND